MAAYDIQAQCYNKLLCNTRKTKWYHVKRPAFMGGPVQRTGHQGRIDWVSGE